MPLVDHLTFAFDLNLLILEPGQRAEAELHDRKEAEDGRLHSSARDRQDQGRHFQSGQAVFQRPCTLPISLCPNSP